MFLIPFLALALGFLMIYMAGGAPFSASEAIARYSAVAILAGLDTVLGGLRAWLTDKFDDAVFLSGFFLNALLAVGLVYFGELMGLQTGVGDGRISVMMIGAVVVFSKRILDNLAVLRRLLIDRWRDRHNATARSSSAVQSTSQGAV